MPATSEARGLPVWAVDLLQGPCQDLGMHFAAVVCVTGVAVEASVARRLQLAVVQGFLQNSAAGQVASLVMAGLLEESACYLADPCNLAAVEMEHDWPSVAAVVAAVAAAVVAAATVVAFSLTAL